MACTYYTTQDLLSMANADAKEKDKKLKEAAEELNLATRLLCELCTRVERLRGGGVNLPIEGELKEWWGRHKVKDEGLLEKKLTRMTVQARKGDRRKKR